MSSRTPERDTIRELRYEVRGRVQGVGFRWWTKLQAARLGLTGSVRNRVDGSVEVMARGEEGSLRHFGEMLHRGPPGASVEEVEEGEASGVPRESFDIQH